MGDSRKGFWFTSLAIVRALAGGTYCSHCLFLISPSAFAEIPKRCPGCDCFLRESLDRDMLYNRAIAEGTAAGALLVIGVVICVAVALVWWFQ